MNIFNSWNQFLETGSIVDYLDYRQQKTENEIRNASQEKEQTYEGISDTDRNGADGSTKQRIR